MATRGAVLGVLSQIFDCTSVPYHNHFKIKSFLQYFLKGGSTTLIHRLKFRFRILLQSCLLKVSNFLIYLTLYFMMCLNDHLYKKY